MILNIIKYGDNNEHGNNDTEADIQVGYIKNMVRTKHGLSKRTARRYEKCACVNCGTCADLDACTNYLLEIDEYLGTGRY